jgi:hypothetical protein
MCVVKSMELGLVLAHPWIIRKDLEPLTNLQG